MYILFFLCFLVTVQETLVSIIGLPNVMLSAIRALADITAILLFLYYFASRTLLGGYSVRLSGTGYEPIFIMFFLYSFYISFIVTESSISTNIAEILVLNRFVFLAMAGPFILDNEAKLDRMVRFVGLLIVIQVLLGLLQAVGGAQVKQMFAPTDYANFLDGTKRAFTVNREVVRSNLNGSLGDFVSFGYFMIFGIILYASSKRHGVRAFFVFGLLMALMFLSGSRMALLCGLIITTYYLLRQKTLTVRLLAILVIIVVIPIVFLELSATARTADFEYASYLSVFDPQFIDVLMSQRLGMILKYLPSLFGDSAVFFGLSPDKAYVADYARNHFRYDLSPVLLANMYGGLEDLYPVALLSYYGIFGTFLFYFMQYRIFRAAFATLEVTDQRLARLSFVVVYGLVATNLTSFANQSFENRGATFILWLFVGMYASMLRIYRRKGRN